LSINEPSAAVKTLLSVLWAVDLAPSLGIDPAAGWPIPQSIIVA
jgi:hypothetical protein